MLQGFNDSIIVEEISSNAYTLLNEDEPKTWVQSALKQYGQPIYAKVISVGQGKVKDDGTRLAPNLTKDDLVLIKPGALELSTYKKRVFFIQESDVLAVNKS